MCNPRFASGRALRQEQPAADRLWDAVASKIAIVENPQVAAAMVARGDAPAAIVFATDVHGLNNVKIVGRFSAPAGSPIVYPAAVTAGRAPPRECGAVHGLIMRSVAARQIFDRFGYR